VDYNGSTIPVKNFQQYVDLYIGPKQDAKRLYESPANAGSTALSPTHQFEQISFVNGSPRSGKHGLHPRSDHPQDGGVHREEEEDQREPEHDQEQLILFLRCDIENPAFNSQTKDYMNTPSSSGPPVR
jgi:DNA topoisomerase-2